MVILVCVDDRGGMMFNRRRQSRDRKVMADILEMAQGGRVWMNSYSAALFEGQEERIAVDEEFLMKAGPGEFCFVENSLPKEARERTERLILYRWNRKYPADVWLDIDLNSYRLEESRDLEGYSHERITREIYRPQKTAEERHTDE